MSDERCSAGTSADLRKALEKIASENTKFDWPAGATADEALSHVAVQMRQIARAALAAPQPVDKRAWRIEHDGFEGVEIGSYTTLEGKEGVVLQQIGSRIVHVYGRKWLKSFPADSAPACVHKSCDDPEWCAGEPQCRYGAGSAQTERMTKALELADECEREVGYSSSRMCSVAKTIRSLVNQPQPAQAPAVTEFCATCGELWVDGTPCNQPEPNCQVTSMGPIKLTYIKRWRTLVELPEKYADEIKAALAAPQPADSADRAAWAINGAHEFAEKMRGEPQPADSTPVYPGSREAKLLAEHLDALNELEDCKKQVASVEAELERLRGPAQAPAVTNDLLPCPFCGKRPRSGWNGADGPHDDCGYWSIECCGAFVHEDDEETARKLWNKRALPQPAQAPVVTEEMIEVAARELWNDRDAQYGGSWDSRDSEEVCVIQTKATARAMLIAALALPQPVREELVARAMYDWQYGTGAWRYSESKSRDHFIGLARAALAMFGQPQTPAVTKEGGK